jgi:hypothetical protein
LIIIDKTLGARRWIVAIVINATSRRGRGVRRPAFVVIVNEAYIKSNPASR